MLHAILQRTLNDFVQVLPKRFCVQVAMGCALCAGVLCRAGDV